MQKKYEYERQMMCCGLEGVRVRLCALISCFKSWGDVGLKSSR